MKQWFYALCAFLGGVSFGIPSTFVKIAYSKGFSTADVVGAQFLFGAIFLWIIVLLTRQQLKTPLKTAIKLLLCGSPMALTGTFYYLSLNYLDASIAIIMLFQFTWMGIIGEWILEKTVPSKGKIFSALLLFIGSLFAVDVFSSNSALPLPGILWGLLAATSFTTFLLVSGKVAVEVPVIKKSTLMATGGLIVALMLYPPVFLFDGSIGEGMGLLGLVLGLFGVTLPPLLFSISMPKVGGGIGTILSASELPTAIVMSIVVLHERVIWIQWIGVLIVLVGIALPYLLIIYNHRKSQEVNSEHLRGSGL